MSKFTKKIITIILIFAFTILLRTTIVKAASASISASTQSPQPGQTVTVTGSVSAGAWNLQLSGAGKSETIYGYTTSNANSSASKSISFVAGSAGTQYTISLTGDMTDINSSSSEGVSKSITITVANATTGNSNSGKTSASNNTGASTEKKEEKSNNANLSNLGIRPNDFSGFKAATTSYDVSVPEDVEEVEVYATAQHSKATVSGTGKKKLEIGQNTLSVVVTAEDGTKKTYTINVTRGGATEEEPTEEFVEANGLSELKIEGLDLSPEFAADVYEYTVKYIGEDTKLDITTVATDASYVVEVVGNEELKEGENVITILVSDEEGNNIATYQIIVNKSLVDEEALQAEQAKAEQEKRNKIIIGCSIAAVIVVVIIIILIVKHRRNAYYDDDWETEEDHNDIFIKVKEEEDETPIDNSTEEIEVPKSIRKSRIKEIEEDPTVEEDKETLRQKFLDNYNSNNYDDYEEVEEKPRRRKQKGKRFK